MAMYVRKGATRSGATQVQIVTKQGRKIVNVEHIGSAHTEVDVAVMVEIAKNRIREHAEAAGNVEFDLGDRAPTVASRLVLQRAYSRFLFDTLAGVYARLGFDDAVDDEVFRDLVIACIIEPSSKLDTFRILDELGLQPPSNSSIHRCLDRVADSGYRDALSQACVQFRGVEQLTLVLYDVTTLFFQVEKEDEYRKPGLSKERRLEPQIVVGLLVDQYGFPLQVHSFEGNTAETLTLVPVLDAFRKQHPKVTVSVACDAGMLSAKNLDALEAAGYGFIVGSRIAKTPYDITEYQNTGEELSDGQIFESMHAFGPAGARRQRRVVYQYREKRARLDLRNIDKQVEKVPRGCGDEPGEEGPVPENYRRTQNDRRVAGHLRQAAGWD